MRKLGWDKKRAVTETVRKQKDYKDLVILACNNGIGKFTFYNRVSTGWDPYVAATTSIITKEEMLKRSIEKRRKYSQEIIDIAKSNGISYNTFYFRVNKMKWDVMRAATTPIRKSKLRN